MRKTQQYRLSLQDEVIDEKGFFVSDIPNFGRKLAFDFVENITETLATIGNLVSKQEVKKRIPYSSETNTRLIRRIVPGIILDFSQY